MEEKIKDIKMEHDEIKSNLVNVYDLAIKAMERNSQRERFIIKILLFIIISLLLINGYFAYVFTTTTVAETTEQEGIYNFVDSEGTEIDDNLRNMLKHFKYYVLNKKDYQINSTEIAKAKCLDSLNEIMYDLQKIMEELKTSSDFQQERDIIKTKLREMFSLYN